MRPVVYMRQIHEHGTEWMFSIGTQLGGSVELKVTDELVALCLEDAGVVPAKAWLEYKRITALVCDTYRSEDL